MTIMTPYELMEKLISFPTVSRDPNTDLIDWVELTAPTRDAERKRLRREQKTMNNLS